MKGIKLLLLPMIASVAIMAIAPEPVTAQWGCGDCAERFNPWPMKQHKIPESEDASHGCGDGVGCHGSYEEGSCGVYQHWHGTCGPDFAADLEQMRPNTYALVNFLAGSDLRIIAAPDARRRVRDGV